MKNIAVVLFAAALLLAGGIFLHSHNEMTSERKFMIAGNTAGYYSVNTSSLTDENKQIDNKNGIPVKKRKPGERRPVKLSAPAHEKRKATNLPYKLILQNALLALL